MKILFVCLLLIACASVPRTGNLPLVLIHNESYSDAVVSINGVRFTEVRGSSTALLSVPRSMIPASGEMRFTAWLRATDETIRLPVVQYREGRRMRLSLKPTASTAW